MASPPDVHRVEIAYAQGKIYARCRCGWEGTHRPQSRGSSGRQAYWAAERDAVAHEEQAEGDERQRRSLR